jgi:hypothetical protein
MTEATKDTRRLKGIAIAMLSGLGVATLALGVSDRLDGADHIDSPSTTADQAADIADLYAFERNGNLVLAMTLSEIQTAPDLLLGESLFDPRVLYQFNIDDRTDGDEEANLVVQAFALGNSRNQQMRIVGPVAPEMSGTQAKIVNGKQLKVKVSTHGNVKTGELDGVKAFAGVRDDPFFFDFVAFTNIIELRKQGVLDERVAFRPEGEAVDTFAGLNTYAIVLEISPDRLNGISMENLRVWATTSR